MVTIPISMQCGLRIFWIGIHSIYQTRTGINRRISWISSLQGLWKLHNYEKYLDMIMQADNISSSWDREEPEDPSSDKHHYLKVPLYSVFSKISTGENKIEKMLRNGYILYEN
jgi:hypothetical protein